MLAEASGLDKLFSALRADKVQSLSRNELRTPLPVGQWFLIDYKRFNLVARAVTYRKVTSCYFQIILNIIFFPLPQQSEQLDS